MTLYDELYFDINVEGAKSDIQKFVRALKSGALEDFFEFDEEQLDFDDGYDAADAAAKASLCFSNVDIGIEIEELEVFDLLDELCRITRPLEVRGEIYDADNDEYRFVSHAGDSFYINADREKLFNEELDKPDEGEDEEEESEDGE